MPWHRKRMLDPQPAIASLIERYPRTSSALYQLLLGVITFECALSIARYDHNPDGSSPVFLSPAEMNATHEHICKISAREADIPVEPLRYVVPYFMLCPSTSTLIGVCIAFVRCLIEWSSYQLDPIDTLPFVFMLMVFSIKWTRILESIQMLLPVFIWSSYAVTAIFDPFLKWAMPVTHARLAEYKKERRRLAGERWDQRKISDMEVGEPRQFNSQTPLTGRLFARNRDEAYIAISSNGDFASER